MTEGALGRASHEVSNLDLERNNTRQGQCGRAQSIKRILTNDPVEAPFRPRIASEGHMHRLITAGTSNDRRVIHSILHDQPHRSC